MHVRNKGHQGKKGKVRVAPNMRVQGAASAPSLAAAALAATPVATTLAAAAFAAAAITTTIAATSFTATTVPAAMLLVL